MSIRVEHLTKEYGEQKAVNDVTFEAPKGQILGFLGPNGAGKTTTMKILTCFIPQTSGEAFVCGHNVREDAMAVRKSIGYLPEHNPLYKDMYVMEYLRFTANMHRLGKHATKRVEEMIDKTGLSRERKKKIGQLSKGYRQRVGLAQALIHDPQVLILDEPTSGLDPNQLADIRLLIKQLGEDKTVILSTHIMQEVQFLCDRVIIINKGSVVADDDTKDLTHKSGEAGKVKAVFKEKVELSALQEKLPGLSIDLSKDGTCYFSGDDQDKLAEKIFLYAKESNVTLLRLEAMEDTIEDVFKALTKENA